MDTLYLIIIEGIALCFILLLACVIGIANGPHNLAILYEDDVQKRLVDTNVLTKKQLRKQLILGIIFIVLPSFVMSPIFVYGVNGVKNSMDSFLQMTLLLYIQGLFDRLFIDWYWVGKTKAWNIPNTDDLKPYIPTKVLIMKWIFTIIGNPIISLIITSILDKFFI